MQGPPASPATQLLTPQQSPGGACSGTMGSSSGGVVLSETQLGNMALRAKQQRFKAEQDRQLLQNRINRLIIEQEKAEKRIAETVRRTEEISTLKARNEANAAARKDASAWLSAEQELQRELLKENKEQRTRAIQASRQSMYALRQDEVKVLKMMRFENEEAAAQHREMERERALERKNVVRESQKAAAERKQREGEALRSRLKVNREAKRQELDADAMSHLNAYSSLAEEEARLVESLAKWNTLQTDAQGHLEQTLGASRASSRPVSRGALAPSSMSPRTPAAAEGD